MPTIKHRKVDGTVVTLTPADLTSLRKEWQDYVAQQEAHRLNKEVDATQRLDKLKPVPTRVNSIAELREEVNILKEIIKELIEK